MHCFVMDTYVKYVKENYIPENMTKNDLEELYYWSKSIKELLASDYYYHEICKMEECESEN